MLDKSLHSLYSDILLCAHHLAQQCYYNLNHYQSDAMCTVLKHIFAYAEMLMEKTLVAVQIFIC
jgi:hypothetical protein